MKTVGENVLELIKERKLTQKKFSELTSIPESTISDWKHKKNNPSSDKILIICEVLNVTPEKLLSGGENKRAKNNKKKTYVIDSDTDLGIIVEIYQNLDNKMQDRLLGYVIGLSEQYNKK